MSSVNRRVRQKVIAAAAVAVLLAGGALAAVSATGQSNTHSAHAGAHAARSRELVVAAGYLGISTARLSSELASGKTLAQLAEASSGKSKSGLIDALIAARKAKLGAAATKLEERAGRAVNRVGGPGASASASRLQLLFAAAHTPGTLAAGYLGVAPTTLQSELRSGKTLAQLAAASPGSSEAGLIETLVAAKQSRFDGAAAARKLTGAQRKKRQARLQQRMTRLVRRRFS